jgi:predicted RNase H-like HicB family nuclease
MKFTITLDRDEDGVWVVECPSIPGCVSQGATRDEALVNIKDAFAACLEVRAVRGMTQLRFATKVVSAEFRIFQTTAMSISAVSLPVRHGRGGGHPSMCQNNRF